MNLYAVSFMGFENDNWSHVVGYVIATNEDNMAEIVKSYADSIYPNGCSKVTYQIPLTVVEEIVGFYTQQQLDSIKRDYLKGKN